MCAYHAFQAVRMLCGKLPPGAGRHADHQRHGELAARHVRDGRGVVDDLVQRQKAEIHCHDLDDRTHTRDRRTNPGTDITALGQRRVANRVFAQFVCQTFGDRVAAAIARDVLAHQEDARIGEDRFTDRLLAGLAVGHALQRGHVAAALIAAPDP